jgi:hypothetical protein
VNDGYARLDGLVVRSGWRERLPPGFDGERVDLPLNRAAPH